MLFYIRLFKFCCRLLTEYFRLALKNLKHSLFHFYLFYSIHPHFLLLTVKFFSIILRSFFVCFLLILVTLVFCCGIENCDISLVSEM